MHLNKILVLSLFGIIGFVLSFSIPYTHTTYVMATQSGSMGSMNMNQGMGGHDMAGMNMNKMRIDTKNAVISQVVTKSKGISFFSSISLKYHGDLPCNHIGILQTNPHVKIIQASISPKWESQVTGDYMVFHSDKDHLSKGETLVIKVTTDSEPKFKLSLVAAH